MLFIKYYKSLCQLEAGTSLTKCDKREKNNNNLIPGIFTLFFMRRAVYAKQNNVKRGG